MIETRRLREIDGLLDEPYVRRRPRFRIGAPDSRRIFRTVDFPTPKVIAVCSALTSLV